ncbi:MAG: DUF167 domain-containing protein [Candidatus Woesearchaeota archaeon]
MSKRISISEEALKKLQNEKTFEILVKPSAKTEMIEWDKEKSLLVVWLREPAENNRANESLLKMLKRISGQNFEIKTGTSSRKKIVQKK